MSVLVTCRGLDPSQEIESVPIREMRPATSYEEALDYWGVSDPGEWVALPAWRNRLWDDLLRDALDGGEHLVHALRLLAGKCDEVAIWYAGFPDEIPVTTDPNEFVEAIAAQVETGELEPAARLIRKTTT